MAVKDYSPSPVVKIMIYAATAFILVVAGFILWSFLGGPALSEEALPVDKPPVEAPPAVEPEPLPTEPIILEPKYFGTGTNLPMEDPLPAERAMIGFNLPIGTPIFQLFDGYVASGSIWYREYPDQKMDNLTMHQNPEGISILNTNIRVQTSAIQFEMVAEVTDADGRPRKIKKGELIARVASTEAIEKYKEKGSFNVRIYIQSFGPEMEEEIQQWITALTKK